MTQKSVYGSGKKALLRVGVLPLLAVAVAGVIYLRQGGSLQPATASEGQTDLKAAIVTADSSRSEPLVLDVAKEGVDAATDPATDAPGEELSLSGVTEPVAEVQPPTPAEPVRPPEPPKSLPKLVDLGADKCIPCKQMAPILEELRVEYAGVFEVVFIDVWKNPKEADKYGIRIIPTQIFYDANGNELFRHVGFYSKEQILAKWKQLGVAVGGR